MRIFIDVDFRVPSGVRLTRPWMSGSRPVMLAIWASIQVEQESLRRRLRSIMPLGLRELIGMRTGTGRWDSA